MASTSPYRSLPVARRQALVLEELSRQREMKAAWIQRLVSKGGGFRAETLRKWPLEQLAREITRRGMENFADELRLLQMLYVELEPEIQKEYLDLAGVAHEEGSIPEELQEPYTSQELALSAAGQLIERRGDEGLHYLRTIATYNGGAWPGLADWLTERSPSDT